MNRHRYSIRYWPTHAGLGLLWCLSKLPWTWQLLLGRQLGKLFCRISPRRKHITATNLALCFPELTAADRETILQEQFASLGIGVLEMAMSWWGSERQLKNLSRLEGLEHLHRALQQGKGAILLSAHFTTLEIGGRLLSMTTPFHVMYRPHKNAAFEATLQASRTRHFEKAIPRGDLRGMLRSLKENTPVWYAPDQDHGREQSTFVPFFGISAATITGTSRLARISKAPVVPFFQTRLPGTQGYQLTLYPALEHFPGNSVEADTARVSAFIEARVREQPGQYLWAHRRFKTRPDGETGVYD